MLAHVAFLIHKKLCLQESHAHGMDALIRDSKSSERSTPPWLESQRDLRRRLSCA